MPADLMDGSEEENRISRNPNKIYVNKIRSWYHIKVKRDTARWERFCKAVKTGDAKTVEELFNAFLSESISIRDTAVRKEKKESFSWAFCARREAGS